MNLKRFVGTRVYFDVNSIIYFIEQNAAFLPAITPLFEMIAKDEILAYTSGFSLTEILIHPISKGYLHVVAAHKELLLDPKLFTLTDATTQMFLQAAEVGGKLGMRTPDAIHLVSAIESQCQFFITNDKGIKSHGGVNVIYISDLMGKLT